MPAMTATVAKRHRRPKAHFQLPPTAHRRPAVATGRLEWQSCWICSDDVLAPDDVTRVTCGRCAMRRANAVTGQP